MPEGHLVHRYARLQRPLAGAPVRVTSPQGRFADGAAAVDGLVLDAVEAHGKHLLHRFGDLVVHTHLGMRGVWASLDATPPPPKPQVRLRLVGSTATWDLFAPSACELLDADGTQALLARLGPDPLRGDDPAPAREALRTYAGTIGEALLDQALFAGSGNVFRAEVLAALRLDPRLRATAVDDAGFESLWNELAQRMRAAEAAGEIEKSVYKHEACARCGSPVEAFDLPRGRTAYACTACQLRAA